MSSETITGHSSAHNQSLFQNYLFKNPTLLSCSCEASPSLCSRQDVANQMCTKSKEECEKHYMKHFINNPLFASTLLNLKQAEEAQHHETAIPFHCEYPSLQPPHILFAFIPKGITCSGNCLGSQEFSSLWVRSWMCHIDKAASSMGKGSKQHGLTQTSGSQKQKFPHSQSTEKSGCFIHWINPPQSSFTCVPQDRHQCASHPAEQRELRGVFCLQTLPLIITEYTLCPRPNCWFHLSKNHSLTLC